MATAEIIKQTFLIEVKDITGKFYYFRIEAEDEIHAQNHVLIILSERLDDFIKVYSDTDCYYEYAIRKGSLIGYRIVHDLMGC